MEKMIFMELGFPIMLVNPPVVEIRGHLLPDINLKEIQKIVFQLLIIKPVRLTGAEVRFIRKYLRYRQIDFARMLNMSNHSVISQWENQEDSFTGMEHNTEILLRMRMALKLGRNNQLADLLQSQLKSLAPNPPPLEVILPQAA